MFSLVQELWSVQQIQTYVNQINIPQTIVILPNKPLQINWYFSGQDNRILKRKGEKVSLENVLNHFKKISNQSIGSHKIVASIIRSEEELFTQDQVSSVWEKLDIKFVTLNELQEFVNHYINYPNLLDRVTIIQEYLHDTAKLNCQICQSYMSVVWNANFNIVQQLNERSPTNEIFSLESIEKTKELKLSPHFRNIVDKSTTELIQKIEMMYSAKRGRLINAQLLFKVHQDKLYFLWLTKATFEKEIMVRNSQYKQGQGQFWQKANNFSLCFTSSLVKQKEQVTELLLKLGSARNHYVPSSRGSQTDRSMNHNKNDTSNSDQKKSRPLLNQPSFRLEGSVQDSFRSSVHTSRLKSHRTLSHVDPSTLIQKINKNRSQSFCRTIKTVQESVDLKNTDCSTINSSLPQRGDQSIGRIPLNLKLNTLMDNSQVPLTARVTSQEPNKQKNSLFALRKITNSMERSVENLIVGELNQKARLVKMKPKLNQRMLENLLSQMS